MNNVWRIAMFVFMLQVGITLVSLANLPIKCTADGTACIPFNVNTISSTTMQTIINEEVNTTQYKTVQLETDIFANVYQATSIALNTAFTILYSAAFGILSFILFVFGSGPVSTGIAVAMQSIVWIFYLKMALSLVKEGKGDV